MAGVQLAAHLTLAWRKTLKSKNVSIIGYGASTKGNIVLNYNKLGANKIAYICDANVKKYGKFTPGTNIKIISILD